MSGADGRYHQLERTATCQCASTSGTAIASVGYARAAHRWLGLLDMGARASSGRRVRFDGDVGKQRRDGALGRSGDATSGKLLATDAA